MGKLIKSNEVAERVRKVVEARIGDWYDIASLDQAVIESSKVDCLENRSIYILKGYVDVEFKTGWRSSARERSRSGRVLFSVTLNAEDGKILSLKHKETQD